MPPVDSQTPLPHRPRSDSPAYLPAFLEQPKGGTAMPLERLAAIAAHPAPNPVAQNPADGAAPGIVGSDPHANGAITRSALPIVLPLRVRRIPQGCGGSGQNSPAGGPGAGTPRPLAPPSELKQLSDVWNSLAGNVPFRSFQWVDAWWHHYQRPSWETYLLVVEDAAARIVGIAPWYLTRSPITGRELLFLGSGEVCSEYQTILAEEGCERPVAAALAEWLSRVAPGDWDALVLLPTLADDRAMAALAAEFAARGNTVWQRPAMPCWRSELAPSWDQFVRQLSKSRRQRLAQLKRKYFDTGRVQTRTVAEPAQLDAAFSMFVDMHQRRRQSLGQPGCYSSPRFAEFHAEVSRRFAADGKLRLLWTELDGRPIGAEYDFIDGNTVYYYSTGVEPAATADHPGWLAMIGSLRRAIDDGCRWFDFLRGDEAYKCSWGAKPIATVETHIVARRAVARLRHRAWLSRQHVRQWIKQLSRRGSSPVAPADNPKKSN
jgi:CelD/BcsL family acetyltransferase involved in cellulose biosynthesis